MDALGCFSGFFYSSGLYETAKVEVLNLKKNFETGNDVQPQMTF